MMGVWQRFCFRLRNTFAMDEQVSAHSDGTLSVKVKAQKEPTFERVYKRAFPWGSAEVERETCYGRRHWSHVRVAQRDGRNVLAAHDRIASEVLVPVVAADVLLFVQEVEAADRRYMAARPDRFTDDKGFVWQRMEGRR